MNAVSRAVHELEQRFAQLAPEIPDGAEKEALSVLHGLILETRRELSGGGAGGGADAQVADLWKTAPAMEGAAVSEGLPVGEMAPDFELPDDTGQSVRLRDLRGRPTLLVFYPLDWSPGCSQQLDLYQQEIEEFERRGVQLIGISVDSIYSHGAWAAARGISFPLLSDFQPKGEVARRYGVWREQDGFSDRALFLIDADGRIAWQHVSPQLHHIPDIYDLFDELDKVTASDPQTPEPAAA
jgi:peroxiredoxin